MSLVKDIILREEGWRDRPYYCSENYPTVGYGFKLAGKGDPLPDFILPRQAGDAWLDVLIEDIRFEIQGRLAGLNEARQAIILSMCYQMGIAGCLAFRNMWKAIDKRDFKKAAAEMKDSRWAMQTPARAKRHHDVMLSGSSDVIY